LFKRIKQPCLLLLVHTHAGICYFKNNCALVANVFKHTHLQTDCAVFRSEFCGICKQIGDNLRKALVVAYQHMRDIFVNIYRELLMLFDYPEIDDTDNFFYHFFNYKSCRMQLKHIRFYF
jgi:hypothetical protein